MESECSTNPAAGDRLTRILHDQSNELAAIGLRIAAFDACVAVALARHHAQAAKPADKTV